jgi:hypothetical protein
MIVEKFVLPDGSIVDELPEDQMKAFKQKVMDLFTPLLYEWEMKKLSKEA